MDGIGTVVPTRDAYGLFVGARGFEPPTPSSRTRCATRLRYAPKSKTVSTRNSGSWSTVLFDHAQIPERNDERVLNAEPKLVRFGVYKRALSKHIRIHLAGVAQMVRAGVSYALGRGFDSLRRHSL
jgi:hypothetical protein